MMQETTELKNGGTTELQNDGTTELKDESAKYSATVMMSGKFMKLIAKTPPKGYYYDKYGRLRSIKGNKLQGGTANDGETRKRKRSKG